MELPSNSTRKPALAHIKARILAERVSLRQLFLANVKANSYLGSHCRIVDSALRELWLGAMLPSDMALLAVGGYGRGELFPYSDVDVLVLLPSQPLPDVTAKLEGLIGSLWDTGLEVGHSVRTIDECIDESRKDITVQTALIEARLVAGNRRLFLQLTGAVKSHLDRQTFFKAKRLEQEQRHARYQDTPYSLEPNIKESPGGLRDLQTIMWISHACDIGHGWHALSKRGFITASEARALTGHERFLKKLRTQLHFVAGRREDRLMFEYQTRLASDQGLRATAHRRASEQLMERYYRSAKAVTQLNTILLQNLSAEVFPALRKTHHPLDDCFQIEQELLDARDPEIFEKNPSAILRSFLLLEKHAELKGMTATTLRALWRARPRIDRGFRCDPANRALFLEILQQPRGLVHALRRMNQYSILGRYLPIFGKVVGQMQHDLFHVYTVDQHILMVVRNLRRFAMVEFAHEFPFCSRLMTGFERNWILYVAAIFHDIAKGRGGDHSALGRLEARKFCREHLISQQDSDLIEFLVGNHLMMSSVAQKQDLSDPAVIDRFLDVVENERKLTALYLLTVADIRGTSPKVWNAWKAKLLEDLFHATRQRMSGNPVPLAESIQAKQDEARRLLRLYALRDGVESELWSKLDIPYFLRYEASEIAWQTRLLSARFNSIIPVVKARLSPVGEGLQVLIYTPDQNNLFAQICGFFESIAYSIVDAKVHTTRHGYALDTFQVMGVGKSTDYRDMIRLVEHDLQMLLEQKGPLRTPAKGRLSRQLRHFPITPEVHIRPDENGQYSILSITAGDRPGLLYGISRTLGEYHLNLHTAKIATLGDRAEDTFLVSGDALHHPQTVLLLEQDLLQVLQA